MPTIKEQVAVQICKVDTVTPAGSRARGVSESFHLQGTVVVANPLERDSERPHDHLVYITGLSQGLVSRCWLESPQLEKHSLSPDQKEAFAQVGAPHQRGAWFSLGLDPITLTAPLYQSSHALLEGSCGHPLGWLYTWETENQIIGIYYTLVLCGH